VTDGGDTIDWYKFNDVSEEHMGEKRNAYGVLARKPKRNRPGRYLTNMLDTLPLQVYGTSLLIW
jgi:hypothetical protein